MTEIWSRCGHLRVPSNTYSEQRSNGRIKERCLKCKRVVANQYQATYKRRKAEKAIEPRRKTPRARGCTKCDGQSTAIEGRCYECATGRPRILTPETLKEYALANPNARVDAPISARGYRPIRGAE